MILSFHPIIVGDQNRLCAGRPPGPEDLRRIQAADAVILPQGCSVALYEMARQYGRHVFPNYDARFRYPGKLAQLRLFQDAGVQFPKTLVFADTASFFEQTGGAGGMFEISPFPLVFKFDWGGEGETVWLVRSPGELEERIKDAAAFEKTGQCGFMLQEYIPAGGRSLRVVVIGEQHIAYWRVHRGGGFYSNLAKGATIEHEVHGAIREKAVTLIKAICAYGQINLAAFDLLFSEKQPQTIPYLLEINHFFGRSGLGGSEAYYHILRQAVEKWLRGLNLSLPGGVAPGSTRQGAAKILENSNL
jgi:ribosomal protein S6--L-glutamate ligase